MFKIIIASVLFASACAIPAGPPPPPGYGHAPAPHYDPRPYAYEYAVADDYHGVNFGAHETSDGKAVTGGYEVLLPDGRTQTVNYVADHYTGYVADVKYSGAAAPYHPPKPVHVPIHAAPIHAAPYHPGPPIHG